MTENCITSVSLFCLLLPLLSFSISTFCGKKIPRGGDWLALLAIFGSLISAILIFIYSLKQNNPNFIIDSRFNWLAISDTVNIQMGILIDNISSFMLVVVTVVSFLVHLYSVGYMHGDKRYHQFFSFLSLFSFSMILLVLADNLLLLYVGWELVGLSSYLLIGFYFEKNSASLACKKAFITNRIGDFGMFIGILIIFVTIGNLGYKEIFLGVEGGKLSGTLLTVAGIALFCGAIGKSAQFPLHVWLPDAMEGPTPVSALIHAATMVAAGVYMVTRIFLILTPDALIVIAYVGAITAILGATIAVAQYDIKRVLAYSTISQLGYMIMGLGVSAYTAGFFHLMTHAAFKACLFLGSGSVIVAMHHEQDIRNMGGLKDKMPITFWTFLIATLALCGVPLTSGFLSKDAILAGALGFGFFLNKKHFLLPLFGFCSAFLTAFYMFRLVFLTFFGKARDERKYSHAKESPCVMTLPLIILASLSLWFWFSFNPFNASGWFQNLIKKPHSNVEIYNETHGTSFHGKKSNDFFHEQNPLEEAEHKAHIPAMVLSILVASVGIFYSYKLYYKRPTLMLKREEEWLKENGIFKIMHNKWYFDEFYQKYIITPAISFSRQIRNFDFRIIDGIVNGVARATKIFSFIEGKFDLKVVDGLVNYVADSAIVSGEWIRKIETGRLQQYLVGLLVGVTAIILFSLL